MGDLHSGFSAKNAASMKSIKITNTLDADDSCTLNNNTKNAQDTSKMATISKPTHNTSATYHSINACYITDDNSNTPNTVNCLSDNVSTNKALNTPEMCDCLALCASNAATYNALTCGSLSPPCISEIDKTNAKETGDCEIGCVSENKSLNIQQTNDLQATCLSANDNPIAKENLNKDVKRILTELLKFSFTLNELNGYDLLQLTIELKYLKEKGLFTDEIISNMKIVLKEYCVKELNMDDYNIYLDALKIFSRIESQSNKVSESFFFKKIPKTLKHLKEKNELSEEILSGLKKIEKENYEIQNRLAELKSIDIPGIVESMKTIEEIGLLHELLSVKLKKVAMECSQFHRLIVEQQKRKDDLLEKIENIIKKFPNEHTNKEENPEKVIEVSICYRKNISPNLHESEEQLKKVDTKSQSRNCKSEHNTPFCVHCGWRSSWAKAFKKRGVYITEVADGSNKHIWRNSINHI